MGLQLDYNPKSLRTGNVRRKKSIQIELRYAMH